MLEGLVSVPARVHESSVQKVRRRFVGEIMGSDRSEQLPYALRSRRIHELLNA